MNTDVTKFDDKIYQIDVHMEGKPQRMSCYYIDTSDPILIEVGPSNSFPYLISALESLGIQDIKRTAITHLHLDHVGGIGHLNEKYKKNFVYVHELGLKHLPNPERLWREVSDVYTEEWLKKNWGEIKPIPLNKIKSLNDGTDIKLETNRNLKALYSPGHAKHHYTFYDEYSGTLFMGDTLGLIYPHGDFVQPNLPPPDFDKDILFQTLDSFENLELKNSSSGSRILLKDIADITFAYEKGSKLKFVDGNPAVELWVRRSKSNDALEVSKNVKYILLT